MTSAQKGPPKQLRRKATLNNDNAKPCWQISPSSLAPFDESTNPTDIYPSEEGQGSRSTTRSSSFSSTLLLLTLIQPALFVIASIPGLAASNRPISLVEASENQNYEGRRARQSRQEKPAYRKASPRLRGPSTVSLSDQNCKRRQLQQAKSWFRARPTMDTLSLLYWPLLHGHIHTGTHTHRSVYTYKSSIFHCQHSRATTRLCS